MIIIMFNNLFETLGKVNTTVSQTSPNVTKVFLNDMCDKPVSSSDDIFKIVIVLDESGSMDPVKDKIKSAIDNIINEQKQVKTCPTSFTLVKFNDNISRVINNKLITSTIPVYDYNPSGNTRLYDAIGDTINWFRNEKNVLLVIVTDGHENASKEYNQNMVTNMIEDKKLNNKWTYVYLSCDNKTFKQGLNIGLNNSETTSNCVRPQAVFGSYLSKDLNQAISNYRTRGVSIQSQLK